jgi:hypothetical protein
LLNVVENYNARGALAFNQKNADGTARTYFFGRQTEQNEKGLFYCSASVSKRCIGNFFDTGEGFPAEMKLVLLDNTENGIDFSGEGTVDFNYSDDNGSRYFGTFFIEDVKCSEENDEYSIITISARDSFRNFDIALDKSLFPDNYTQNMVQAFNTICDYCGVSGYFDTDGFYLGLPNAFLYPDFSSKQIQTCRDALAWIGRACGGYFSCSYNPLALSDMIYFTTFEKAYGVQPDNSDEIFSIIDRNECTKISISETRCRATYITAYVEDEIKTYKGSLSNHQSNISDGVVNMQKNPLFNNLSDTQQDTANKNIIEAIDRVNQRGIELTMFAPYMYDIGNHIKIDNNKGVSKNGIITRLVYNFHKKSTIICDPIVPAQIVQNAVSTFATTLVEPAPKLAAPPFKSQIEKRIDGLEFSGGGQINNSILYIQPEIWANMSRDYETVEISSGIQALFNQKMLGNIIVQGYYFNEWNRYQKIGAGNYYPDYCPYESELSLLAWFEPFSTQTSVNPWNIEWGKLYTLKYKIKIVETLVNSSTNTVYYTYNILVKIIDYETGDVMTDGWYAMGGYSTYPTGTNFAISSVINRFGMSFSFSSITQKDTESEDLKYKNGYVKVNTSNSIGLIFARTSALIDTIQYYQIIIRTPDSTSQQFGYNQFQMYVPFASPEENDAALQLQARLPAPQWVIDSQNIV